MATNRAKQRQSHICKSRKIIESFYVKHFTLLRYLRKVKHRKATRLIQDHDLVEYRVLLKSTIVGVRDQSAVLPNNPTQTQWFTLKEIINRVIEHVCQTKKTNVLAFGFEALNGYGKKGTVVGTVGIQNSYPNTIVSCLRTSRAWQLLHARIGDDLMMHLLQNVSMFVKVNSKCYFQVAGYPISRLSPLSAADAAPGLNSKPVVQSAGGVTGLKRKTRRGGKRARRHRENFSQSKKEVGDLPDVPGPKDETHRLDVESARESAHEDPVEMDGGSHDLDVCAELPQNKKKRKMEDNVNNEQPQAKKARVPCNVSNDADKSPECSSEEKLATKVSPLLFSDESGGKSSEESTQPCVRSGDMDPAKPVIQLSLRDNDSASLLQENIEENAVEKCSEVENYFLGTEEKESSAMSTGTNVGTLKRKKSSSKGSGRKNKTEARQKPWEYLTKILPKAGQTKRHPRRIRSDSQAKQNNRQKRNRPASQKNSNRKGIRLNEVSLPRATLFYSSNLSQTLPKNHIMQTSPASMAGARKLAQQIFLQGSCLATSEHSGGIKGAEKRDDQSAKNTDTALTNRDVLRTAPPSAQKRKPLRLPKMVRKVQPLLLKFLAKHKKCPFSTLLKHHCYYQAQKRDKKNKKRMHLQRIPFSVKMMYHKRSWKGGTKSTKLTRREKKPVKVDALLYRHAVNNYTKHDQVVRFLQCICHKVVPKELWGSSENKATFLRNLSKFIRLRRAETFSLGQMMAGIKVSSCKWLKEKGSESKHIPLSVSLKQQQLLAQFFWWFVTEYLMVVLKTFFYITESDTHRQRVFYYRKPVWRKIHCFGLNAFCGEFFKPLKTKEAEELLQRPSSLGFSLLRFIPKSSTVRPITNMRHCPVIKEPPVNAQKPQSVNWKLQNVFEILKFEKERNPKSLGSTLFGIDDLYRALKPFVTRVRTSLEGRPLYFVHVDVKNCYESILHQKLFDVIKQVLEEEEYLIRRFVLLRMSAGKVYREFSKHVSTADDCRSFPDFFRSLVTAWKLKQVIAVDNVWYATEDRDKLVNILSEHIFNNIVRIGNNYYQQERGIAQGSVLSTMLCGYYYSQMERTHLSEISEDPDSLLLRWVDDFLVITPRKSLADKFLNVMHAGIPEYGCFINHDKTLTNYDVVAADGREVKRIGASERFPWCGFLLDTVTLEVSPDLSRYTGLLLRDTLTVSLNAHPGEALRRKLLYSVRPKCHPLLLDHHLNTRHSTLLNVYQVFLLTAYKFHTYVKELPRGGQPKDNPPFFCRVILDLAQYFHSASSRKCRQMSPHEVTFSLDEREVTWLCFHAFQSCLRKKQSRYGELLKFLRKGLSQLRLPAEDFKAVIETDTPQHAVFKLIR